MTTLQSWTLLGLIWLVIGAWAAVYTGRKLANDNQPVPYWPVDELTRRRVARTERAS